MVFLICGDLALVFPRVFLGQSLSLDEYNGFVIDERPNIEKRSTKSFGRSDSRMIQTVLPHQVGQVPFGTFMFVPNGPNLSFRNG